MLELNFGVKTKQVMQPQFFCVCFFFAEAAQDCSTVVMGVMQLNKELWSYQKDIVFD